MRLRYLIGGLSLVSCVWLVACGGGGASVAAPLAPGSITVSVTGLTANSPSITLSEEDSATAQTFTTSGTGSDTFVLNTPLASGSPYSVVASESPAGMTCSESANGTATLPESSTIQIACSTPLLGSGGGAAPTARFTLTTIFQNGISSSGSKTVWSAQTNSGMNSGAFTLGPKLPPNGIWPLGSFAAGATYNITMTPPSGSGYTCVLASTSQPSSGSFNSTPDPVNVIFNCGNPGTP